MNDKFYEPGGPVFLQIGGEGTADPIWMENGAWVDYAQTYKAMMFQVEHRYYGKTWPTRYDDAKKLKCAKLKKCFFRGRNIWLATRKM
jgi:hypothetical protein